MTARLPGRPRSAPPPRDVVRLTEPRPARCPSGKRRYQTKVTADSHHRVSRGGSVSVACAQCQGFHHERRAPQKASG